MKQEKAETREREDGLLLWKVRIEKKNKNKNKGEEGIPIDH
jgi:hypothetical protein